jgi:hypothetical protein
LSLSASAVDVGSLSGHHFQFPMPYSWSGITSRLIADLLRHPRIRMHPPPNLCLGELVAGLGLHPPPKLRPAPLLCFTQFHHHRVKAAAASDFDRWAWLDLLWGF